MVVLKREGNVKIEPPSEYTKNNVAYWEPESKSLHELKQRLKEKYPKTPIDDWDDDDQSSYQWAQDMLQKVEDILYHDCIKKEGNNWKFSPLPGNSKSYILTMSEEGILCDCQGFKQRKKCTHQLALKQILFMEAKNEQ